jgi:hypothetical protein
MMLKCYTLLKDSVVAAVHFGNSPVLPDMVCLEEMCQVLENMHWFSIIFSAELQPRFGLIFSAVHLAETEEDSPFVKGFKAPIRARLVKWLDSLKFETHKAMLLAVLFDPRHKNFGFLSHEPELQQKSLTKAHQYAIQELDVLVASKPDIELLTSSMLTKKIPNSTQPSRDQERRTRNITLWGATRSTRSIWDLSRFWRRFQTVKQTSFA